MKTFITALALIIVVTLFTSYSIAHSNFGWRGGNGYHMMYNLDSEDYDTMQKWHDKRWELNKELNKEVIDAEKVKTLRDELRELNKIHPRNERRGGGYGRCWND